MMDTFCRLMDEDLEGDSIDDSVSSDYTVNENFLFPKIPDHGQTEIGEFIN